MFADVNGPCTDLIVHACDLHKRASSRARGSHVTSSFPDNLDVFLPPLTV